MSAPHSKLHVAVLLGGPSAERAVSLRSGTAVAAALEQLGYRVTCIDPAPGSLEIPADVEVVFLALHGEYGEDGAVQTELERLGIPFTGCDATASRIAFDKVETKKWCEASGIPTPRYCVVDSNLAALPAGWQPPLVLKPARQGSSVGLRFVDDPGQWQDALKGAIESGSPILVEERVEGRETTVGVLAGQALPIVEVRPRHGRYDYANKYTEGATEYLCPAPFDAEVTRGIQTAALAVCKAIGVRDFARVDVMVRCDREPFVLEVNTLPGMTATSLLPKAAAAAGLPFPQLCQRMVELALVRNRPPRKPAGKVGTT